MRVFPHDVQARMQQDCVIDPNAPAKVRAVCA